jgi:FkbM family methyltransferase
MFTGKYLELEFMMQHPSPVVSVDMLNDIFNWLLKGLNPDVICDIGSFDASDSIRARTLVPNAGIFAFEANPRNHALYCPAAERANVHYEHMAIAHFDGEITLNVVSQGNASEQEKREVAGQSSIFVSLGENRIFEPVPVPCRRLDTYLLPRISASAAIALWVDAEGAGYQVLLGATETLKKTKLIKIETEYWPYVQGQNLIGDIRNLLTEAGFTELVNNDSDLGQCDLIWIRV